MRRWQCAEWQACTARPDSGRGVWSAPGYRALDPGATVVVTSPARQCSGRGNPDSLQCARSRLEQQVATTGEQASTHQTAHRWDGDVATNPCLPPKVMMGLERGSSLCARSIASSMDAPAPRTGVGQRRAKRVIRVPQTATCCCQSCVIAR